MEGGEHIKKHLEQIERNIELNTNDPVLRGGFTQVPNFVLKDPELSMGAKVTYSMFLSYAWNNDYVFPGQDRLAEHLGVTQARVSQFTKELSEKGLLEVTRRGLGKSNLYKLNFTVRDSKASKNLRNKR